MLFSIIIPVYNTEKYLSECIESVLKQKYRDYEIILVDDGSTDHSGEICDAYEKTQSSIRVIHKENGGQLLARVEGIRVAQGEYYVHLDSDDTLNANALEIIKNKISKYNPDLMLINASRQPDFSVPMLNYSEFQELLEGDEIFSIKKRISKTSDFNNYVLKIAKKNIVDIDVDYSNVKKVRYGEDLIQSLQLIDRAKKIVLIQEPLYFYRPNEKSITHRYSDSYLESIITCNRILLSYINKWDKNNVLINNFYVRRMVSLFNAIYYIGISNIPVKNKYKLYNDLHRTDLALGYEKKYIEPLSFMQKMLISLFMHRLYIMLILIFGIVSNFRR